MYQCQCPDCDVTKCYHWKKMGKTQNLCVLFLKTAYDPVIISTKISIKKKAKHIPAVRSDCPAPSVCMHPRKTCNRLYDDLQVDIRCRIICFRPEPETPRVFLHRGWGNQLWASWRGVLFGHTTGGKSYQGETWRVFRTEEARGNKE